MESKQTRERVACGFQETPSASPEVRGWNEAGLGHTDYCDGQGRKDKDLN